MRTVSEIDKRFGCRSAYRPDRDGAAHSRTGKKRKKRGRNSFCFPDSDNYQENSLCSLSRRQLTPARSSLPEPPSEACSAPRLRSAGSTPWSRFPWITSTDRQFIPPCQTRIALAINIHELLADPTPIEFVALDAQDFLDVGQVLEPEKHHLEDA